MLFSRYSVMVLALFSAANASPNVSWVKEPPQEIHQGESFELSWRVEGLEGSYHSLCFFCPESSGEVCRKGPNRLDSQIFDANETGQYHYTFTFDANTPEGKYYATAIGAYSRSDYHPSKSILVNYQHSKSVQDSPSQNEESDSNNSQQQAESESSNTTVVVRAPVVAPVYYWDDEETTADVDVHTSAGAAEVHENHKQRQEAHQEKHENHHGPRSAHDGFGGGRSHERAGGRGGRR